jgi:hypothetical protein
LKEAGAHAREIADFDENEGKFAKTCIELLAEERFCKKRDPKI